MKALTIRQPWASLIASRHKTIELRTWTTDYRGPLVVTAAKTVERVRRYPMTDPPLGVTVCLVRLVGIRRAHPGDAHAACVEHTENLAPYYAWILDDVRPLVATPVRGMQSIWEIDSRLVRLAA